MKVFGVILLALIFINASSVRTTVYICVSKSAYAYHYDLDCRGLNRCTHEIRAVSEEDAVREYGRKLCGYED